MSNPQPKCCEIQSCTIEFRIRYAEVDRQNAVHHSQYAIYFEMGRTELLRINNYNYKTLEDTGSLLVVARLDTQFKYPAQYDDEMRLLTEIDETTRFKLIHKYTLRRKSDRKIIATGTTTLVHVDTVGKMQQLPPFLFLKKS